MDLGLIGLIGSIVSPIALFILANIHLTLRRLNDRIEDIQKTFHRHALKSLEEYKDVSVRLAKLEQKIEE